MNWRCRTCHYIYVPETGDPRGGVPPGTAFEELASDWVCPVCGASQHEFDPAPHTMTH